MSKKYQIFVSSTFLDLIEERQKVANAIFKADHIPVGMELFPASTLKQWQMIKELIDTSDYYILVVGARYGTIARTLEGEGSNQISYTQKEYEYAYNRGIPIYTFFRENLDKLPEGKKEKTEKNRRKLDSFVKAIKNNGYYYEHWDNADELSRKVLNALNHGFHHTPRAGWVRSDRLIEIADEYNSGVEIKEKIVFYKFLHLSNQSQNSDPIYKKYIKRLNKTIDVYDEYLTFRIISFSKLVKKFKTYDSTKGNAVEVIALLPFIMSLRDTDVTIEENPQILQPIIIGPSNVFVTCSHYYNGFQKGNKDTATKADKPAELVRLIVDFSSVKDYESHVSKTPQVFYKYHDLENSGRMITKNIGLASIIAPGTYYAEIKNIREGENIRIEFADDFKVISNIT